MRSYTALFFVMFIIGSVAMPTASNPFGPKDFSDFIDPNDWIQILNFYQQYRIIFIALLMIIGLIQATLGFKILKSTFFLVGFIIGSIPSAIICNYLCSSSVDQSSLLWVNIVVAVCMGIFIGILMCLLSPFGTFIYGSIVGCLLSFYIYGIPIGFISVRSDYLLYYTMLFFTLLMAGFSLVYKECVIFCTSILGSLAITFGLSQFIGQWPNPLSDEFYEYFNNHDIPIYWYIYLGIFMFIFIFGTVFQCCAFKKLDNIQHEENVVFETFVQPKTSTSSSSVITPIKMNTPFNNTLNTTPVPIKTTKTLKSRQEERSLKYLKKKNTDNQEKSPLLNNNNREKDVEKQ
ncbi:hypothetical protein WA158_005432 [Blastocystis sp. Blastoise]